MEKEPFKHLIPGKGYSIIQPFRDYDGKVHQPGGVYTFMGSDFLPYEDGLTLHFTSAGEAVAFRLQWRAENQQEIIENLEDYFISIV
jgi:hypothetical protein